MEEYLIVHGSCEGVIQGLKDAFGEEEWERREASMGGSDPLEVARAFLAKRKSTYGRPVARAVMEARRGEGLDPVPDTLKALFVRADEMLGV